MRIFTVVAMSTTLIMQCGYEIHRWGSALIGFAVGAAAMELCLWPKMREYRNKILKEHVRSEEQSVWRRTNLRLLELVAKGEANACALHPHTEERSIADAIEQSRKVPTT